MAFYDLSKTERGLLVKTIESNILRELNNAEPLQTVIFFADGDTYIRKSAYLAIGKIYVSHKNLRLSIIDLLTTLLAHEDFKVRQTVINAAGEIGKRDFEVVVAFFDTGLFDRHHSVRNAVIGSVKKMGEVNPLPVLRWAGQYLHHTDKEIRREICHGIELRGRKHPQDILPLLQQLQFDSTARVRNTLVHVLGQITYKKGCLETVTAHLKTWDNQQLVKDALEEMIDVHHRYRNFSFYTHQQAAQYIQDHFSTLLKTV